VSELLMLLPRASRAFDGLHVYYFHDLPFNGAFAGDDVVFAQEGARVQKVPGGGDDAVARVTSHALGNALGLPNHGDPRNLMGNGTSGIALYNGAHAACTHLDRLHAERSDRPRQGSGLSSTSKPR
jgi:hypothetical protein